MLPKRFESFPIYINVHQRERERGAAPEAENIKVLQTKSAQILMMRCNHSCNPQTFPLTSKQVMVFDSGSFVSVTSGLRSHYVLTQTTFRIKKTSFSLDWLSDGGNNCSSSFRAWMRMMIQADPPRRRDRINETPRLGSQAIERERKTPAALLPFEVWDASS